MSGLGTEQGHHRGQTPAATGVGAAAVGGIGASRRPPWKAALAQLRPAAWVKNFACLAGLVFSGQLFLPDAQLHAAAGLAAFCLISSAVYIFNDLIDAPQDRLSSRTASRPLATGELSPVIAIVLGLACLASGFLLAVLLPLAAIVIASAYVAMNVLYTLRLKQAEIAEVMCIALGFVLRVLFGIAAVRAPVTPWVLLCIFFLALFLGFSKRKAELGASAGAGNFRPVLDKYTIGYLDLLLAMCAAMTVMCYAIFTIASHKNPTLVITVVPVVYCVLRYMQLVIVSGKGAAPEEVVLSDFGLWIGVAVWLVLCVAVLYGDIRLIAEQP